MVRVPVIDPAAMRPAIRATQRKRAVFGRLAEARAARRTAPARPREVGDGDVVLVDEGFMRPT
jgi:hypothetical protein